MRDWRLNVRLVSSMIARTPKSHLAPAGAVRAFVALLPLGAVALLAALFVLARPDGSASGAGPFDVSGDAHIVFLLPGNPNATPAANDSHADCYVLTEQTANPTPNIDDIVFNANCHIVTKPTPLAPPFLPRAPFPLTGTLDQTDGSITLEFAEGACLPSGDPQTSGQTVTVNAYADGDKVGWEDTPRPTPANVSIIQDTTPPFDCEGTVGVDLTKLTGGFNPVNLPLNTDTDGDGCTDIREAGTDAGEGGRRDPQNPYDYFDVNHDGAINVFDDIVEIAARFGTTAVGDEEFDRGPTIGPNDWNRDGPDGVINVFDDILVAAGQFGTRCPHDHANYPPGTWIFGDHP